MKAKKNLHPLLQAALDKKQAEKNAKKQLSFMERNLLRSKYAAQRKKRGDDDF